ncbi:MAG: aminomethyl-transferring glycine dehydrogenase subunit GcvPB [Deltaproteobacteria bacterium]|nr:aminomethyl-transferring glycine dehydrogenase subunit GcvPB [Deltaproteobacteria bacterium]
MSLLEDTVGSVLSPEEATLFERSHPGRIGYSLPTLTVPRVEASKVLPKDQIRDAVLDFPEISENEVVRHFVRLSQKNYSIDTGFYPLGSCTMKYNPKINEEVAKIPGISNLHPLWPEKFLQPALSIQFQLGQLLSSVTGLAAFTFQPNAGAHGEYAGMKIMRAYHEAKKSKKTKVLIPDSAHGTNPATCAMVGYEIVPIPTGPSGVVEIEDIEKLIDQDVAGIMMTNPNTLGLYEKNIHKIAELIHKVDGIFYMDGANFNAIMGIVRPADLGVDIMHINVHKTFSTPHGGGGPGAGPVGVREDLKKFLPLPVVEKKGDGFIFNYDLPHTMGRMSGYFGNFSIHVRALAYMLSIGATEDSTYIQQMATAAVLNANYIRHRLRGHYDIPFDTTCMHEVVLSDKIQEDFGIKTLDIAKRLMDYGYHPMTVYFPLVVHGAMMIEPTESETKETLDQFCDVMIQIAKEAKSTPEILKTAPTRVFRERLDELRAQKQPRLRWSRA